ETAMTTAVVNPATLIGLTVTPTAASIATGTAQQFTALATFSDGSSQDLTSSVTWTSSDNTAATIDAVGHAVGTGVGTTSITAQSGSVNGVSTLRVTNALPVSIQITPGTVSLPAGSVLQILATARFTDGSSQDVTSAVNYTSSNSAVATVDSHGHLQAVGSGSATIYATLNGVTASIPVTINNAALSSISITPSDLDLAAGLSSQLTATGTFTDGSTQDLTASLTWTSSNPAVASVSPTGNVVVASVGSAIITANNGSVAAQVTVNGSSAVITAIAVSPASANLAAGQTQQFLATATLSDSSQQDVTASVHWSVGDPSKATVSDSNDSKGLVTALHFGSTAVLATANGVSGSANLAVQNATLTSISITPSTLSIPAGTTQMLTVTGNYSDGSTANLNSTASFTSSNPSAATVDSDGVVHSVGVGSSTLTVSVGNVSQTTTVGVTNALLSSIQIAAASPSIAAGLSTQLTATGTYTDGSTVDLSNQVQWSSSAPSVLTVSASGLVSAINVGNATVSARLGATSNQTPIQVTAATLQSIAVTSLSTANSFALGQSLQLKAVGTYSDGSTQDLTSTVAWSSTTPGVGIVNSAGLATGVAQGNFNAKATIGTVTGQLALSVNSAVLQSIAITPANRTIVNVLGAAVQYTATGTFSDGTTQDLTTSVHWSLASGLSVGSISATGRFTPLGLGLGTIQATLGSVTATTGFIVVSVL
ncbi:MAG: beta strand repeat-containing protein, partial [Janthinobacterium lividum]